jgi:DNA-binding beta-propeller fold protein YncE
MCALALATTATAALLAGCAKHSGNDATPGPAPGHAALAPAEHTTPAGTVIPSAPIAAALDEPATGKLVLLDPDGVTVRILDPTAPGDPARTVTLPARTAALSPGPSGQVLAAAGRQVLHIDVAAGTVRAAPVDGEVRAVAQRPDGTVAAGLSDGRLLILGPDGRVRQMVTGLTGADAIAAPGAAVAVLDRTQTTLSQIDFRRERPGLALRAGQGATEMITDHYGRMLVTDTASGALLVFSADPLLMRQMFPVSSSPYALAYDQRSETVWVTLTGSNQVAGYDLSKGIPEEVGRFATVRQPNSVTVDSRTGDLFVASATGDGLQRIGADERKRGQ